MNILSELNKLAKKVTGLDCPATSTGAAINFIAEHMYNGEPVSGEGLPVPEQPDSTAADVEALKKDFNTLLKNLREAGILTQESKRE